MSAQIEEKIGSCTTCQEYQTSQPKEPMITNKLPNLPWTEVASDTFHFQGDNYLLTIDYYSKYIEVAKLADMTTRTTHLCVTNFV
jgi:hypothetical protein